MLAGGRSKRFGSDKLVASYRGAPLIHRPVHALARLGAEVVVVCAPDAPDLPLPEDVALRVVRDAVLDEGPLAGVIAGLAEVRTPTALIAAGDMPELQVAVLRTMLRTLDEPGVEAVWLQDGDRPRPFPLAVRTAPAAAAARPLFDAGQRRLRALPIELGSAGPRRARVDGPRPGAPHDARRRRTRDLPSGGARHPYRARERWSRLGVEERGARRPTVGRSASAHHTLPRERTVAMAKRRVLIMGAAGRDFHNFNIVYRDDAERRGRRVHGHADPVHQRPEVPGRAGRTRTTPTGSRSSTSRS